MKKQTKGFTLIEVLVASAILVMLAAGFLGLQYILSENQTTAWLSYQNIEDANRAISTLTRELRNATPSEAGAYPLAAASDQEIVFYSDTDFDGLAERIRYTLTDSTLVRGIIKPTESPAEYVLDNEVVKIISEIIVNGSDPIFYYYNSDWPSDTINNPLIPEYRISDTRQVKVIVKSNSNPNLPEHEYVLESDIKIRYLN